MVLGVHWIQLESSHLRYLIQFQMIAGLQFPEGLTRLDIQDGMLTGLLVDVGCQLEA